MVEKRRFFYGYVIVVATACAVAVAFGTIYSFSVFLKPVSAELGWSRAMTTGTYSLRVLLSSFLSIIAGRLTDRFGPRLVVTVCGIFLGVGHLLMSQVNAIWQLYLFYGVIVAIGSSGSYVPLFSTVARWFTQRRGMMTGIAATGVGIGTLIIPPLATWLISTYGWRISYIVIGVMALVLMTSAAQLLQRDPAQMGVLPYGAEELPQGSSEPQARGIYFREAMSTRQFGMVCATFFCFGYGLQTVMVHIVPHATDIGIPIASAARILAVIGGASIVGRIIIGSAGDRIGIKSALIIVLTLLAAALFWLTTARELWKLYLFALTFGFAYGGFVASQPTLVAELFGLSSHGAIFGAAIFIGSMGEASGSLLGGVIFDTVGSYYPAFLIGATLNFIALTIVLFLRAPGRQRIISPSLN